MQLVNRLGLEGLRKTSVTVPEARIWQNVRGPIYKESYAFHKFFISFS